MFLKHGCNVYLAEEIKKVVKVPVACVGGIGSPELAEEIIAPESNMFHKKAIDKEVKKYIIPCVNTTAREITPEGVICTDLQGKEIFVKADTVILSAGMRPRTKVVEELEGVVDEFYMIGDCVKAGQVTQAMSQAYFTAREI